MSKRKVSLHQSSSSILSELNRAIPSKKKEHVVESRGHHIISSAVYFLEVLAENYSDEEADLMRRRFLGAIKNGDPDKFIRTVRKIREAKEQKDKRV